MKTFNTLFLLCLFLSLLTAPILGHSEVPFADKRNLSLKLEKKSNSIISLLMTIDDLKTKGKEPSKKTLNELETQLSSLSEYSLDDLQLAAQRYSKAYVSEELNGVRETLKESERQKARVKAKSIHDYLDKLYSSIEKVKANEELEKKANTENLANDKHKVPKVKK